MLMTTASLFLALKEHLTAHPLAASWSTDLLPVTDHLGMRTSIVTWCHASLQVNTEENLFSTVIYSDSTSLKIFWAQDSCQKLSWDSKEVGKPWFRKGRAVEKSPQALKINHPQMAVNITSPLSVLNWWSSWTLLHKMKVSGPTLIISSHHNNNCCEFVCVYIHCQWHKTQLHHVLDSMFKCQVNCHVSFLSLLAYIMLMLK